MSDDDEAQSAVDSHIAFDPHHRSIHASIQYYAQNQYPSELRALCMRELIKTPNDPLLLFWSAFAAHKQGDHDAAIAILTPLSDEKDLSLAAVALLLTSHNSRSNKDKKLLLELKSKLKLVSKQSTEASLQLAGRYFLYTNKIAKAKQCIEKLIAKDKKNIDLLSLFGWIYLQSNEERYIEKSMQVFKKAAKLSIPNFDISALMGRAKYFEHDGKLSKAIQALDSIIKIYPDFIAAVEEKLRLTALSGKWKDLTKLKHEIAQRRAMVLGEGARDGSLMVSFVSALERFLQSAANEKAQLSCLQLLQAALTREEKNNSYWIWQYVQLFTRLTRKSSVLNANKNNSVLQFLDEWIAQPLNLSSKQKTGVNINYLYESSYLAYLRGEFDRASQGFRQVADAVLATEKGEKDDDDKAEVKEAKVNEDERYQKSQAALHLILILIQQGKYHEAQTAVSAIPMEYRSHAPSSHSPEGSAAIATNSFLYIEACLAWHESHDASLTTSKLMEYLDAHMHAMKERSLTDGIIVTSTANAVQGINRFFILLDPLLFMQAAQLFLLTLNQIRFDPIDGAIDTQSVRPTEVSGELLSQFLTAVRHVSSSSVFAASSSFFNLQAIFSWIEGDMDAATLALDKLIQLEGEQDARVKALKHIIQGGVASGVTPTPRKPAAAVDADHASSSSSSIIAAVDQAPNTAQRKQFRAALGEEVGLNFDDDEEDVDALFKDAEDGANTIEAEKEAQALLDDMEARARDGAKKRENDLRMAEEARMAKEVQRKKQFEEMNKQAEIEAKLALEKASKKDLKLAEQRKQEEIAALRQLREAEKKRKEDELEKAEREREEQRERDRIERLKQREDVTTVQAFTSSSSSSSHVTSPDQNSYATSSSSSSSNIASKKPTQMKWNFPNDSPSPISTGLTPLSLQQSANTASQGYPASSPLSNTSSIGHHAQYRQSPTNHGGMNSGGYMTSPTASQQQQQQQQQQMSQQQLAHQRQLELQRSEESRALQEKKDKIMQAGLQIDQAKKFTKVAFWGEVFLKHGRRGSPHERNVTLEVTGSELKFDWSSGQLKAHKNDIQLVEGKGTAVFQRPTAEKSKSERCFSIVTANRSLDLEAPTDQARDYWVTGIKLLLKYLK